MRLYLDTSVLVSLYVPEKHTAAITAVVENFEELCISRLTEAEFYSAIALKVRTKELTNTAAKSVTQSFTHHLEKNIYEKIHITDTIFETAIDYLTRHKTNLRTLDALHLACCANTSLKLITADKTLASAAKSFGVHAQLL